MILLTGFDPFGGEPWNASFEAVRELDGESVRGRTIVARCLPTEFVAGPRALDALVAELDPELVVATGQAAPDDPVRLETTFVNEVDAARPDNTGLNPVRSTLDSVGERVRRSSVSLDAVLAELDPTLRVVLSDDAGRFVCNALGYRLAGLDRPAIFVHLPSYGARDAAGRAELDASSRAALRAILVALVDVVSGT